MSMSEVFNIEASPTELTNRLISAETDIIQMNFVKKMNKKVHKKSGFTRAAKNLKTKRGE